jgi:hypothetical protein
MQDIPEDGCALEAVVIPLIRYYHWFYFQDWQHQMGLYRYNTVGSYLGGTGFESQSRHWLS